MLQSLRPAMISVVDILTKRSMRGYSAEARFRNWFQEQTFRITTAAG